jgi:YMGG-like Gly-zipper
MFQQEKRSLIASSVAGVAMVWTLGFGQASAQTWQPRQSIDPGTSIEVRTSQPVDQSTMDGRVFTGVVDQDVKDTNGRLAIPRGATTELVVRTGPNNELYLDLDSISVNGQRYAVDATRQPVAKGGIDVKNSGIGNNSETVKNVGGGALLGTVIGAIVGGGKGAAVGAATGAAVGAGVQVVTHGKRVNVPAETLLTYRLQSALSLGVKDTGYDRNGLHYHRYNGE